MLKIVDEQYRMDNVVAVTGLITNMAEKKRQKTAHKLTQAEFLRQEMTKYKEARQARSFLITAVHQHILAAVGDYMNVDDSYIMDGVLDRMFQIDLLVDFVKKGGRKVVMFISNELPAPELETGRINLLLPPYATMNRFVVTDGSEFNIDGSFVAAYRMDNDSSIELKNVCDIVCFLTMQVPKDMPALSAFYNAMSNIHQPYLHTLGDWGTLSTVPPGHSGFKAKEDLLINIDQFVHFLNMTSIDIDGRIRFEMDNVLYTGRLLEVFQVKASAADYEIMVTVRDWVKKWYKQILLVATQSNQIRREDPNCGPSAELEYWRRILSKYESIIEFINSKQCKNHLLCATIARCKIMKKWRIMDNQITDVCNEATDNVKYLTSLQSYLDPLYRYDPVKLLTALPPLLFTVRMIATSSRYFNTSNKLTSLLGKVTNQLINRCNMYLTNNYETNIWLLPKKVLLGRIKDCFTLYETYLSQYNKTLQDMEDSPKEKPFFCSPTSLFGRFKVFLDRLNKIADVLTTTNKFSVLQHSTVEGIAVYAKNFADLFLTVASKTYDPLAHRKPEFDVDYEIFKNGIAEQSLALKQFVGESLLPINNTENAIILLNRFKKLNLNCLRIETKYMEVMQSTFLTEIEELRDSYNEMRTNPPIPRNAPPVSGRIMWVRNLYQRMEIPMEQFKKIQCVIQHKRARKCVKLYNCLAGIFIHYEIIYHQAWCSHVVQVRHGLSSPILLRDPTTDMLQVNMHPYIMEAIYESECMLRLGLAIPDLMQVLLFCKETLQQNVAILQRLIDRNNQVRCAIPKLFIPLLRINLNKLDTAWAPGLATVSWSSTKIPAFCETVTTAMDTLTTFVKSLVDIKEARIDHVFDYLLHTCLVYMPDDPLSPDDFKQANIDYRTELQQELNIKVSAAETATIQLINAFIFTGDMEESDLNYDWMDLERLAKPVTSATALATDYIEFKPIDDDHIRNDLKSMHADCIELFAYFNNKMTDTLVKMTRHSLELFKERAYSNNPTNFDNKPLMLTNMELQIPIAIINPTLDTCQAAFSEVVMNILAFFSHIETWGYKVKVKRLPDGTLPGGKYLESSYKNYYRTMSEHKDVLKGLLELQAIVLEVKPDLDLLLDTFKQYAPLWDETREDQIVKFVTEPHLVADIREMFKGYNDRGQMLEDLPNSYQLGCLQINMEKIKLALIVESNAWKNILGRHLSAKNRKVLTEMVSFIQDKDKILSKPLQDLDDVRIAMVGLEAVRENFISLDMALALMEETYALFADFKVPILSDDNNKIYSLRYKFDSLLAKTKTVQEDICSLQDKLQEELETGMSGFLQDVQNFVKDYEDNGPMVPGIAAREASDRVMIFQSRFDELWRRYEMYASGERLFGLTLTEYPSLEEKQKEFNLLNKLYSLYLLVIKSIDGYYDLRWTDVDTEVIITELTDLQNKCRRLPKAMTNWPAYKDLKKKIDDFNETCPLLELMANKAMKERHWKRLEELTGCSFDVDSASFTLKNVMEAPLLKYKDDVEDICIGAIKERDIDVKLKQVIADWSVIEVTFANFKARGELLLKGADVTEIITLLEDSLMVLNSLLSNRYNAPLKKDIQLWVWKLVTSGEILEKWLMVQSIWVYLEAVFVGGDIAVQLPAEAKRFSTIDKTWVKIMYRARDNPNCVECCVGDDTMINLLPFLLEQLETCQKSLTGYLEQKRLCFPRFFFISDPVMLEILGQASDPQSIKPHLLSIFDAVASIDFDEKHPDTIVALLSAMEERVPLENPVLCRGGVEVWLGALLAGMKESLKAILSGLATLLQEPDFDFIASFVDYCGQAGLLGVQLLWTTEAEQAINTSRIDRTVMKCQNQRFLDLLNSLIELTVLDLTRIQRICYETMVTIHVHQRDIFDDMVRLHIRTTQDFEWQKQSRFYFIEDTDDVIVKITDVDFLYQNEYLGVTERLAVTPLTDRCYVTLAQSIGMYMGGAPAGPAGTGKTETTKDMGRALGKLVVVFNCSDQMDFRGLGRIYKGLAQSGSWGCFDEFNRIELPVLSVAAQQIYIVLTAKKEHKKAFLFSDGDIVSLDPEFGLFITMNPGYAGRQELPENLKIQFRTVAMMVPDRQIIIRVKLASCGFKDNVPLSRKFFTLYKLCEEQLSKQVHYDFGLRNILSVLRTLGAQKRANPKDSEETTLMRVLKDMNVSKLIDEDEPLFLSLIDDMFPGMKLTRAVWKDLQGAITNQSAAMGVVNHDEWNLKIVQLYETSLVRHGLMILGPTGSGKTACIHCLQRSFTELGKTTKEMRMNPKAITASQMFGRLDVATNDWTDGIFSTLWRRSLKMKKTEFCWLVLDGPVDAVWIENLNSVLDDNKTLTLANGDRITMSPNCKLVFEPDNVDNASPATVSRMGMVFISSSVLQWTPILQGWLKKRPLGQAETLLKFFSKIYDDLHSFVQAKVKAKMAILEAIYIRQCCDLLTGLLDQHVNEDEEAPPARSYSERHLEKLFLFAVMWSLGAVLELDDRQQFQEHAMKKCAKMSWPKLLTDESIFEYVVDDTGAWQHWNDRIEEFIYPDDSVLEYSKILVPNVDNVRTAFLIHIIAKQRKAVLLIGEQGTAKTVMLKSYMSNYDPEYQLFKSFNFSSATTPNMFQRIVESYVDKRVGTTYGPPNQKKMTIFIDDINMPIVNEWGDQVTNEIVRQLMANSGFYSLDKPGDFSTILDVQLVAAMIHPGGGRNDIPPRLKRQFNVFNCALPSTKSMDLIFNKIGEGYFCSTRFNETIVEFVPQLIALTRILWQQTKIKMLPTPAKFHYVFNLRDLSRIWQGILTIQRAECKSVNTLLKLWKHECIRVIADRFTNYDDRNWFIEDMRKTAQTFLGNAFKDYPQDETYFVDFLREPPDVTGDEPDDFDYDAPKIYEEIPSVEFVLSKVFTFMSLYNENVRGAHMDMVFFHDAMVHLFIISRIVRMPRGNALLVGVGGSGKQSLTKLATYIANYQSFQITMTRAYNFNNLQDDLKLLYRIAGHQGKGITFLFTDNDIKEEGFLEFINNVLSSGEIANLFPKDELDEITSELINPMKKFDNKRIPTFDNLYDFFISRARNNLHVALCFSPVGEKFRNRSLKFPGLISGCTVDWFQRWPKDALVAVSNHFLEEFEVVATPNVKYQLIRIMGEVQDYVADLCVQYYERFRRQAHVTPKSFLSFLVGYKDIYKVKHENIAIMAERMKTGLIKLVEAGESVAVLRKELEIKDKGIRIASAAAEVVLVSVTKLATAAEAVKLEVLAVKDKAIELVAFIAKDTAIAETKLAAARPALAAAEAALQTIKAADIATVRKLGKPPYLITLIMDAVIILFKKRLEPVRPDMERKFLESSWADSLKLMADTRFLAKLIEYPKDSINGEIVDLLKPYLTYELYTFQNAKSACGNVAGLIQWTMSMATFYGINKEVLPLKLNLASLQNKYDKAKEELDAAEALLKEKEDELAVVQAKFDKAMSLKQAVLDDAAICQAKMDAAVALIDGLAGERIRWTEQSAMFASEIERLIGDVLILTGFLSYAGPFNQEFRTMMQASWVEELLDRKMPVTMNLSILDSLTDTATIGEWNLQGLPTDDLSIQNGIIVTKAARFPLLIDPQGQGKAWINNLEKDNQILVTTLNHKYFRNHIEDAISLGLPILIEDVAEELDPALDNVLERNYIKMGNTYKVRLGDKEVDVTEGFRVYITTKLPNPAYTPEISARTSIIDFTVTMQGLEDQLLGRVILTEKKELETERTALIQDVTNNRRKMKQLEANLLHKLTTTQGSLVDDVTVIGVLNVTKATANEVSNKLDIARDTELKINTAREEFRPVATRGSVLYFLIVNVSLVNCMYQTALSQFLERFDLSMSDSPKSPITTRRIKSIISYLTYDIFQYTCRGLYENHKYMFALMMTLRIDIQRNIITHYEFGNFIKGGAALDLNACPNKPFFWITDMTWLNLVQLSTLRHFQYILTQVEHSERSWKSWFATDEPEDEIIPDGYQYNLDVFRRLLLVRAWCPDRTLAQSRKYVSWSLGPDFAEPVVLDFDSMHLESKPLVPLICFLSMGSDPTPTIEALAKKIAKDQEKEDLKVEAISMGQGQEVHARKLVATCMEVGQWALLQNCHLGLDYMNELLLLLQDIEKTDCVVVHEDFRVWMTTEVHPDFPISLLQMSLKFTNEPPSGIKAGLKRTYASMNQDWLDYSESPQYLPLIFAVSFLHTVVQERRKFGPLGWNIPYEFNSSDWLASCYFVQNHLEYIDPKKGVSWSTVRYMLGEVQYGGRVTDDYDKRLLTTLCKVWFLEKMFDDSFQFYKGYKILKYKSIPDYLLEIDTMNNVDPPQAYGLHFNADITYQSNSTAEMLETILSIQPKESGGGAGETREVVVSRLVKEMQSKLPQDFDPFEVKARLMKLGSTSSMNIFLRQEIDRMQKVITLVRQTLKDLLLAIEGTIIMNEALGDALDNIYDARIPNSWKRGSWVSSTLGFWFTELLERCTQFNTWCFKGRPPLFWMTGFFNPQGFLTAMRQEVARAHKGWALDAVTMHNEVTKYTKEDVNNPPNEGVYVYGLYMDGAGYDKKSNKMCESTNKVLFTLMPVVHVYAINSTAPKNPKLYECPVYKKPQRTDLTFITPLWLNTMKPPEHWTMRGVALLCDIK